MRGNRVWIWLALVASPSVAHAGAWTLPEGVGQAVMTATTTTATQAFQGLALAPTPRYRKFELQGLIEYGLTDRFTVIAAPGLQHVDIAAPTSAQRTGLGYAEFGGRYRVLTGDSWVFSAQTTVRIPGTADSANPAAIGYTGVETDIRGLLGYSFGIAGMPSFVDLQLAQRFRGGAPPDEFRADVTLGIRPAPKWLVLAQSFNVFSEGSGVPPFTSYDYQKFQLSAVYELTPWFALQAGVTTTYAGRNALQENGLVLGAWYKF